MTSTQSHLGYLRHLRLALACACVGVSVLGCSGEDKKDSTPTQGQQSGASPAAAPPPFAPDDPGLIAANNRGVGLMGKFQYREALAIFEQLAQQHPTWREVQVNRAIATLNRQQEGDEAKALELLNEVLAADPQHVRANYCVGLLRLYLESPEQALAHFELVAAADPGDAYAAYYVGQCRAQSRNYAEAAEWYAKAVARDPYLRSAYYAAAQALRASNQIDRAQEMLDAFQKLEKNPQARLVEFKYTRMGPWSEAKVVDLAGAPRAAKPQAALPLGPVFLDPEPLLADGEKYRWKAGGGFDRAISITAVDIDRDDDIDIFIANVLDEDDGQRNAVCINDGEGRFTLDLDHVLAHVPDVNAALWGDYDNDGFTDVYLCRRGPNMLWKQEAADGADKSDELKEEKLQQPSVPSASSAASLSIWRDVTTVAGVANGEYDTVDGALFDADHDGDLDIFCVNADGPNELFNNNLDGPPGAFRPIAQERGIAGSEKGSRQVLPVDLDSDRDLDLIVINNQRPNDVWINDRGWEYRRADPRAHAWLLAVQATGLVSADGDADGDAEPYVLSQGLGIQRLRKNVGGGWTNEGAGRSGPPPAQGRWFNLADITGDGQLRAVLFGASGWSVADPASGMAESTSHENRGLAGGSVALLDAKGPCVVAVPDNAPPIIYRPGPGRHSFASLNFTGGKDLSAMRSNASGIGTHFAARIDSMWVAGSTLRTSSGPGQSLQPVSIGLGGYDQIDFVSMTWPDGVFQTEVDLEAGKLHEIAETQRQLSSCPVLFAWDGKKFEFVTDLLGVGGIGYMVAPGEYAPPRPWENVLLPIEMGTPDANDRVVLKLGEPMEEACYLDSARLVAYDLPPGWRMTLDERMNISGPEPTGEPRFYRDEVLPVRAVNDRGEDVTAAILNADLIAAPVGRLDHRFIGRLAREHVLTIEFDDLDSPQRRGERGGRGGRGGEIETVEPTAESRVNGEPHSYPSPRPLRLRGEALLLIIDGWVEYPYSQTMFAAWQAGAEYRAPTIEARVGAPAGNWQVVLEQFGYPAGMPRRMSVPLPPLPEGTTALRITTNQEIYFDRIALARSEACPQAVRHELPLAASRLHEVGFAQRSTGPQRQPHYDYDRRAPLWDTRHQRGWYTEFGPVDELIAAEDGAVAIFGPGEEVHMEFDAAGLPPLRAGWARRLVFEARGWCKDMDLYTQDGETLAPLPQPAPLDDSAVTDLHRRFNTRYRSGP